MTPCRACGAPTRELDPIGGVDGPAVVECEAGHQTPKVLPRVGEYGPDLVVPTLPPFDGSGVMSLAEARDRASSALAKLGYSDRTVTVVGMQSAPWNPVDALLALKRRLDERPPWGG